MKSKIIIFALVSFLFLSSFGLIEYSVFRPKFTISQQDSVQRAQKQSLALQSKNVNGEGSPSEASKEQKDSSIEWSKYILMGIKAILSGIIKIISAL